MNLNTVVIVGDRFDPAMFAPENFFGGSVDPDRMVVGPIAQFGYHSGRCRFAVNPSRIDLSVRSVEIMPDELRLAAEQLVQSLEKIRTAVEINGFGLNCDATIVTTNHTGAEICNRLFQIDLLKKITEASMPQGYTQVKYIQGELIYSVRIEPEAQSEGNNLYVAVNGHQAVVPTDQLERKLGHSLDFRQHVGDLHDRIRSTFL